MLRVGWGPRGAVLSFLRSFCYSDIPSLGGSLCLLCARLLVTFAANLAFLKLWVKREIYMTVSPRALEAERWLGEV